MNGGTYTSYAALDGDSGIGVQVSGTGNTITANSGADLKTIQFTGATNELDVSGLNATAGTGKNFNGFDFNDKNGGIKFKAKKNIF